MVNGTVYCLTHTKPRKEFVRINKTNIISDHFKTKDGQEIFLTQAVKTAKRFNNYSGGTLLLNVILLREIETYLSINLSELLIVSIVSFNSPTKIKNMIKDLLFLSDLDFPSTQTGLGIEHDQVKNAATGNPLTPFELWAKLREIPEGDPRLSHETTLKAINGFKVLTIAKALETCPAFETTSSINKMAGISVEDVDTTILNLKIILGANPLSDEKAMTALGELEKTFGSADLSVYEPASPDAVTGVVSQVNGGDPATEVDTAAIPVPDAPVTDAPTTEEDAAPTTDEPSAPAAEDGVPVSEPTDLPADAPTNDVPETTPPELGIVAASATSAPITFDKYNALVAKTAKAANKVLDLASDAIAMSKEILSGLTGLEAPVEVVDETTTEEVSA